MHRVVYRSSASENLKDRPPFYSKELALRSFAAAISRVDAEIVFLLDGDPPSAPLALMERLGEVVRLPGIGNCGSYRAALGLAYTRPWRDEDLLYLAEDDYLYLPTAFSELLVAAEAAPSASYFSLYDHPDQYHLPAHRRFRSPFSPVTVGSTTWRPARSTCMSFCSRLGALREDGWLHLLALRGERPDDFELWSASTGAAGSRFLRSVGMAWGLNDRALVKSVVRRAQRRLPPPALLLTPVPSLATHMEEPWLAPNVDWASVAAQVEAKIPPS